MARRIVNIVFIALIFATLFLGLVFCVLEFNSYEDYGDDAKYLYAFAAIIYPILAVLVLSSEIVLWRSVAFFVSYPGHRRVELAIRILLAAASAATLGYLVYYLLINPADNSKFPLYTFGLQILFQLLLWICQIIGWIAECIAICRKPVDAPVYQDEKE